MATYFYCDHYDLGLPEGHRFPAEKYRLLREVLTGRPNVILEPARLATADELTAVHDPGYVQAFLEGTLPTAAIRRIGFPWSPQMVTRTLASAGGTLLAAEQAWSEGMSGALAGGTHHALYAEGAGFCVFNDIAAAIAMLRRQGRIRRASVVDLDVHQGDGTAQIFAQDPEVFTLSLHGANNFPFRKQQSTLDVPLPDGTGDDEYLEALEEHLPKAFAFGPEIVFYQAGVDPLAEDTLGKLNLSLAGLAQRDAMVFAAVRRQGCPMVISLGGGYAKPIAASVVAYAQTFGAAADLWAAG